MMALLYHFYIKTMDYDALTSWPWIYSSLLGMSFCLILFTYTGILVTKAFFVSALMFSIMSMYGHSTHTDITSTNYLMKMGIVGIIILSSLSRETTISELITSVIGIILSIKIVSYNTEKLKEIYYQNNNNSNQITIMASFILYLDPANTGLMLKLANNVSHKQETTVRNKKLLQNMNYEKIKNIFFIRK